MFVTAAVSCASAASAVAVASAMATLWLSYCDRTDRGALACLFGEGARLC